MRRIALACTVTLALACADLIGASFGDAGFAGDAIPNDSAHIDAVADAAADADASTPFNPATLPGLELWIDATLGVEVAVSDGQAPPVTIWHDRSNNHHDAIPIGMGTNAPTHVLAAINGLAVVHFTAAQSQLLQVQWSGPGGTELTMFLVSRGYAQSALRFQAAVDSYPFTILPLDVNANESNPSYYFYMGIVDAGGPVTTALQTLMKSGVELVTARFQPDGTVATFRNGVLVEQRVASSPGVASGQPLYLGGGMPASYFMNGDIAEALVYGVALDDLPRAEVEGYLREKWGT